MGNYIIHALNDEDQDCVRLACGIISDVANALGSKIYDYLSDFVPPIIKILKEPQYTRETKLQAIITVGDLAMNAGAGYEPYLHETLEMLLSACKVSLTQVDMKDDIDLYEYMEELKVTLIEAFTSIVHGMCAASDKTTLVQHAEKIILYLEALMTSSQIPSEKLINDTLGLIGDLVDCCGKSIENAVKKDFIEKMISVCS